MRLLLIALCLLLLCACHRHLGGIVPDQTLRSRFAKNHADLDSLVRFVKLRNEGEISADSTPPAQPAARIAWAKIHDLLVKLKVKSATWSQDGSVTIFVAIGDADLLRGRYYYFEYRPNTPETVVPSLEEAYPYKPGTQYCMPLGEDNWYASMNEDAD